MWLIYGAGGYTGRKIAAALGARGHAFVAAGRDRGALGAALDADGTRASEVRAFGLEDERVLLARLGGVDGVLNCAGPFARTAVPLARACVEAGVHYLDLAGEVDEHEAVRGLDAEARGRGVMLLPGVGFGCVPTELAAREAVRRLGAPVSAVELTYETVGGVSRGTLETVLRGIHRPGVQRRDGALVAARPGERSKSVELGGGVAHVVTNPWRADLVAVFASTGAPNITTLATFPLAARLLMGAPGFTGSALGQWLVGRVIAGAPLGPSADELSRGRTRVCATATASSGATASVRVHGPEAYVFTARTAASVIEAIDRGAVHPGHAAPSHVLSFESLAAIEGVQVFA